MKRAIEQIYFALVVTVLAATLPVSAAGASIGMVRTSQTYVDSFRPARDARFGVHAVSSPVCATSSQVGFARCDLVVRRDAAATRLTPQRGTSATPSALLGDNGAYSPAYLQSAYNARALGVATNAGAGRVVAVVDAYDNPNLYNDLNYYRSYFGMPACVRGTVRATNTGCVFQQVNEVGQSSPRPVVNESWGFETATDVEMISALCVNCQILVVEAQSASITDLGTAVNTAVSLGANVVSNSYGSPEFPSEVGIDTTDFTHPGVPLVAAAGDSGYGVQFPAAAPGVIAVGGTTLVQNSELGTRSGSESVWAGTGSGCSAYEPKPAWQHDTLCVHRSVNDVAAVANPNTGVWVYDASSAPMMSIVGGTSVAAAIVSALYGLAGGEYLTVDPAQLLYAGTSSMYQVTVGENATCATYLCDASQSQNGYNGPTGVGTFGASPNSLGALATPADSFAPVLDSAVASDGAASLTWSAPLTSSSAVLGYNLYAESSGSSAQRVNSAPIMSTVDTVSGLTNGVSYIFTVEAIYASGDSRASNELAATPLASVNVPGAPSNVIALAGSSAVTVGWTAPLIAGGPAVSSFVASDGHGHTCTDVVSAAATNSCTVTGLTNGVPERFSVVALSAAGPSAASHPSSTVVPAPSLGVRQLSVGDNYGCAVVALGTVDCWGANANGQLGNGTFTSTSSLAPVIGLRNAVEVATSSEDTCAVTATGSVECWGANAEGQLGNGANLNVASPVQVNGITNAVQVSVGTNYACAVTSAGAIDCWGENVWGQLGNATTTSSPTAVEVTGIANATSVVASFNHTCALLAGGSVACWGSDDHGQLASSGPTIATSPQAITSLTTVTELSLGYDSTCALLANASVWCWGYNGDGELGRDNPSSSSTPLPVEGLPAVSSLSTGAYGSCATASTGALWCWGFAGTNTMTANVAPDPFQPTTVTQLSGVTLMSRAYSNDLACAVVGSGALVCWTSTSTSPFVVTSSNAPTSIRSPMSEVPTPRHGARR